MVKAKEIPGLLDQDTSTLDAKCITPLTPSVISRQATINFGTIGHVAHGKSTIVRAISGVETIRFKSEKERNITIKLGYANAKIYKCESESCPPPGCYWSAGSGQSDRPTCPRDGCGSKMKLMRHISFVDCPGHDILMATMLNGAAVMDAALLLIAGNETCPQPQTSEHLAAVEMMQLKNIIILQNKVELVKPEQASDQYNTIKEFVSGTKADSSPIIPISAMLHHNIDVLCEYICTQVPVPLRDFTSAPRMMIIRSFDINKPGEDCVNIQGGVAGGSILSGILKIADEIEIRPGITTKVDNGKNGISWKVTPIFSRIISLFAEHNDIAYAVPGGLIGVGTNIDPSLTRSDKLVGMILGVPGELPKCFIEINLTFYLLKRLLGVRSTEKKTSKVAKLKKTEVLMLNIGSTSVIGRIQAVGTDSVMIIPNQPVCADINDRVALSRRVDKHWRLIGWGQIVKGTEIKVDSDTKY